MVAMAISPQAKDRAFRAGSFALGALCTVLLGVPAGIYVANRANTTLLVQQQTLSQVQTLETTGGQLDNAVRQISDALAQHKDTEEQREALRDAVGAHSSAAFALRDELDADYAPYMSKMNEMREYADKAKTPREGIAMWQSAVDLIAMRKRASDRITESATG